MKYYIRLLLILLTAIHAGEMGAGFNDVNARQPEDVLIDDRDGRSYKTVKIGDRVWMAENLNYDAGDGSFCIDDQDIYCEEYGRLYTWEVAKEACPSGWHLPSDKEWKELERTVMKDFSCSPGQVGKYLKSGTGWYENGNGTDDYGFSILPAGYTNSRGGYYRGIKWSAYLWSSGEFDSQMAVFRILFYNDDRIITRSYNKNFGYSVRCIRDR